MINQNCRLRDFILLNESIKSEKSIDFTISDSMLMVVRELSLS